MSEDMINMVPVLSENISYNQLTDNEFILSNVHNKHYLKISRDVYNILHLVDGERNIKEISQLYESEYNRKISLDLIYNLLIKSLSQYGILKGYDKKIKPYEKPSYLKFSFILINKNTVSKIVKYFFPLFRMKIFIGLMVALIAFVAIVLFQYIDIYKQFDVRTGLLCFFLMKFVSVTFHEIGHATAANYFGAEHGGIGGGFYLFRPVYYADVTDIWRLKKMQRIIVNLSGIYFELLFGFVVLSISFPFHNYVFITTALFIIFTSFFNLLPFSRGDGYWVLSDLIDKPNLSSVSIRKVVNVLKKILIKEKVAWNWIDSLVFSYGLVNMWFMFMLLYYSLIKDPGSIVYFPVNIYNFVRGIVTGDAISLLSYRRLLIPIVFYIIFLKFLLSLKKQIFKKKNKVTWI